jgi:hypothetical protein
MPELWTPGMAGPLDQLVERIHRQVEAFRESHDAADVGVEIELYDGSVHRLATLSAEPGFGFVTLCPHAKGDDVEELIVPLGAIVRIRIGIVEPEQQLGFSSPSAG